MTTSDDASRLFIDNHLVVDNGGLHGAQTQTGTVALERGSHLIVLEYAQAGGFYSFEWAWSRDGARFHPVPGWALSRSRARAAAVMLARSLDWARWASGIVAIFAALWIAKIEMMRRAGAAGFEASGRPHGVEHLPRLRSRAALACFALFIGLTIVETWPLATDPARLSRNDNGDTILNEWILAWVAHQAPRNPLQLFDANIFYPDRRTLAYSEALLVQSALGAPLLWAGASPVLAYNLVLMAGFALSGWAMCFVVARWTNDWVAGIASGILTAFSAHHLARLPHLQAQHAQFLPLALLSLDALLDRPRLRHAVWLAIWYTLQALASYYLFVIMTLGLGAALLARPEAWSGRRGFRVVRYLALAGGLATLALAPYLLQYWRVSQDQGLTRPLHAVLPAFWQDYLSTPARFDYWLLQRWTSSTALFPGFLGLVLAVFAVWRGALRDPRARMCLALGLCGVILSFGAAAPGYAWLHRVFLPLQGIRAASRFGYLAIVSTAVLAGFGVAYLRRLIGRPSLSVFVAVSLPIVITLETLAAPIRYRHFAGIPAIYRRLATEADAVVAEFPMPAPVFAASNAPYMLNSTANWKPLVNGYSGFIPLSYARTHERLRDFPSPSSVDALRDIGVTHVFVHLDAVDRAFTARLERMPALQKVAAEGPIVLYRVLPGE